MLRFFVLATWIVSLAHSAEADVFKMISITPAAGTALATKPTEFRVKVRYTLNSIDRGFLAVYAERYREGCGDRTRRTEGGESVPVTRGTHEVEVTITWRASSDFVAGDQASFVGIGMNLWPPNGGRGPMLQAFGITACYTAAPGPR